MDLLFIGHCRKAILVLAGLAFFLGCNNEQALLKNSNVAAKIKGVSSSQDIYGLGDNIEILVSFDQKVLVSSSANGTFPRISLLIGEAKKYVVYSSGSGTPELIFAYTVVGGDQSDDGIEISSPIDLNGGSIGSEGINAILTIDPPGFLGRVDSAVPLRPSNIDLHRPTSTPNNDSTPKIIVSGVEIRCQGRAL